MRRLGNNESPTADSTRHGLGSIPSKLIAVAFAALLIFFLGTATALADGVLGEVTDPVLDSGQTDESDDPRLLDQVTEPVTEPVTDLVDPSDRESQGSPDGENEQSSPAAAKTADSQPAESTSSQQPDSAGVAATEAKSDSQASEPLLPDEGDTNAPPADETAGDEAAAGSVAEPAETATGVIDQVTGVSNDAMDSISDVAGLPLPIEVVDSGTELVDELTKPLEDALPAISSSVEQAEGLFEGTVELIATSVDAVAQSSTATVDDLLATADHLAESTAGMVENPLAGSSAGAVVAGIVPDVAGQPNIIETGPGPPPPKPVVPAIVDRPRPDLPRAPVVEPGATERSTSVRDAARDARSLLPSTTSIDELLAGHGTQETTDSESAYRGGGPASSTPPATPHSSNGSSSSGLFFVLAAVGALVPRLSRWFRLEPVLWRRYALAAAIDRPG